MKSYYKQLLFAPAAVVLCFAGFYLWPNSLLEGIERVFAVTILTGFISGSLLEATSVIELFNQSLPWSVLFGFLTGGVGFTVIGYLDEGTKDFRFEGVNDLAGFISGAIAFVGIFALLHITGALLSAPIHFFRERKTK